MDTLFLAGSNLAQADNLKESVVLFSKILNTESLNTDLRLNSLALMGYCKYHLGDYRGARDNFLEVLGMKKVILSMTCHSDVASRLVKNYRELSIYLVGLSYINLGDQEIGCKVLSLYGEMGGEDAYESIRKYCR